MINKKWESEKAPMNAHSVWSLVVAGAVFALSACSTTPQPPTLPEQEPYAESYQIGIGDTLRIDVYRNPDLSVTVTVRPDGKITVPVAGDIGVAGQTPEQVSATIAKALGEYIRDPIVTTTVSSVGSNEYQNRIRVTGAVGSPQSIAYRTGMTVMDVVLEAGGLSEFANAGKALLYRNGERIPIRLDRILLKGDMTTNYPLRPGDVITVPERLF